MAKKVPSRPLEPEPLDMASLLDSAGVARTVRKFSRWKVIFSQGDPGRHVFYILSGSVKVSVVSSSGKEAVVAVLGPGEFVGEGCLAAQPRRIATASALTATTALVIEKGDMLEMLHGEPAFAERFLVHMLARNIRIEEDLVDQLFNSSEKRLARALLLLARYGKSDQPLPIPKMSQETLAAIVGTTRSRVNFFMNKFRKLGFIEYNGNIKVDKSLLTIVLHD